MEIEISVLQDSFFLESALRLAIAAMEHPVHRKERYDAEVVQAFVAGAVMCSSSTLECTVNALLAGELGRRNLRLAGALDAVGAESIERLPVLQKYQLTLILSGKKAFREDEEPYQSASALISLRNAMAHPKSFLGSDRTLKKLEAKLHSKFEFSAQYESHYQFFPFRCLSRDCALWAVETAAQLVIQFRKRMPKTAFFPNANDLQINLSEAQKRRAALSKEK